MLRLAALIGNVLDVDEAVAPVNHKDGSCENRKVS
jgi:hypothetical protein